MFKALGPANNRLVKYFARGLARLSASMGWLSIRYPTLSLQDRLNAFRQYELNLEAGTVIRFNYFFVPYIQADSDIAAAYALGAVTEHQRGPQLQFLRRLAQGRLSEMGGRGFVDMDHLIRLLDFGRAGPEIWHQMPEDSRQWVQAFVDGLNAVRSQRPRGVDEKLMGIKPEPYTPLDILLLGRLAGADVNWPIYFSLIEHRLSGDFAQWWERLRITGAGIFTSFDNPAAASTAEKLGNILNSLSRSGSNSLVLSGSRTENGAPLMANDPHLGLHLPNVWMLIGLQCPSYQCVGLMFPGVPVLGLGRNPNLAWGGTNLRAASSDLVRLDPSSLANSVSQHTRIKVRFGWTRKRVLRWSTQGPVLTECPSLASMCGHESLALRWAGHWPTDEISSFLKAMRSHSVRELQQAMHGVGVTPLNVLGADTAGNIGHVLAATLPARNAFPEDDWVLPEHIANRDWANRRCAADFPSVLNPPQGFLVSANNRPSDVSGLGFLFNGDDRIMRAHQLLLDDRILDIEALRRVQFDVTSVLASRLASRLSSLCMPYAVNHTQGLVCQSIAAWSGAYSSDSLQALQFEFLITALVGRIGKIKYRGRIPGLFEQWAFLCTHLPEELESMAESERIQVIPACLEAASRNAQHWQMWGNAHKIRLRHVLGFVPLLGKLFSSRSFPAAGSRETLMKNAHGFIRGFDETAYGSQARHLSDLSNPDANYFTLLGGQDGWVGSMLVTDQITLWQTRQSIQMPLSTEAIAAQFPHLKAF
ncbi:MAG TPA: penicillin acylase family protein [Limnobacter sp.]|uniref:penicillin acylase family protein n=1 Tax=Limnobacter sp. TaxID=2003368 RepID=UPI002E2F890A|nr:penicillin acylase family protein [Limnobacter sp.]HEX5485250.1 penicillin acylase family protein [Limnobacter sp.]